MAKDNQRETSSRFTRRGFLGGIGAGAIGAAGAIANPDHAIAQQIGGPPTATRPDRFSRLFDGLPPFADATLRVQSALREMGAKGGLMDAKDPLSAGPVQLIADPALSVNNPDNPTATAGVTFLGQFLDHDMTFDASSRLGVPTRPERSVNSRTPSFDLDSVYGRGPMADTHLYDPADRVKLKVEKTSEGGFEDVPRTSSGTAIIPDPRNDEHLIISGIQAAFLCFHNKVVDMLRAQGDDQRLRHVDLDEAEDAESAAALDAFDDFRESMRLRNVFAEARRLVTWHYQWIILHEFLPTIVGTQLVNEILTRGRRFYRPRPGDASIPVEFQMAYRFGHSIVRPSYRANLAGDGGQPFFAFIFDPAGQGQLDPVDLRGGCRAARRFETAWSAGDGHLQDAGLEKFAVHFASSPIIGLHAPYPRYRPAPSSTGPHTGSSNTRIACVCRRSLPSLRCSLGNALAGGVPRCAEMGVTITSRGSGKPMCVHDRAIMAATSRR